MIITKTSCLCSRPSENHKPATDSTLSIKTLCSAPPNSPPHRLHLALRGHWVTDWLEFGAADLPGEDKGEVGEEVGEPWEAAERRVPAGDILGQGGRERGRLEVKPSSTLVLRSMFF